MIIDKGFDTFYIKRQPNISKVAILYAGNKSVAYFQCVLQFPGPVPMIPQMESKIRMR